jgi:hypothetical protein
LFRQGCVLHTLMFNFAAEFAVRKVSVTIIVGRFFLDAGPSCLSRWFAAARFLGLLVRIQTWARKCCMLSGREIYVGLIARPEKSYRVCVCV